jgi:hypothetical protein
MLREGFGDDATLHDKWCLLLIAAHGLLLREGIDPQLVSLLDRLQSDLADSQRGIPSDLLKARNKPASRPPGLSAHWEAKAALVVALEAQRAGGGTFAAAATVVAKDFGLPDFTGKKGSSILQWRDQLSRPPGAKAPRDGQHWSILEEGRTEIAPFEDRRAPARAENLGRIYEGWLWQARALLPDKIPDFPPLYFRGDRMVEGW